MLFFAPVVQAATSGSFHWDNKLTDEEKADRTRDLYIKRCTNYRTPPDGLLVQWLRQLQPPAHLPVRAWKIFTDVLQDDDTGIIASHDTKYITVKGTVMYNGQKYTEASPGDYVQLSMDNGGLGYCVYGGSDITASSTPGRQQPNNATFITEPLIAGSYAVVGVVPLGGYFDVKWTDFFTPLMVAAKEAGNALMGQKYLKGSASFEVKNENNTLNVYQNGEKIKKTTASPGVILTLQEVTEGGALQQLIAGAINWMLELLDKMVTMGIDAINSLLRWEKGKVLDEASLGQAWILVRNFALSLLTLFLVLIAFANALQYNIENYGLNRIVPKIIIAIILSYLSWAIAAFMFDLCNAFQNTAFNIAERAGGTVDTLARGNIMSTSDVGASIALLLLAVVIMIVVALSIFCLLITLIVRVVMLSFLVVISPLAFILYILPFSEQYYKRWWKEFFKWMLMGPLVVLMLALGLVVLNSGTYGTGVTGINPSQLDGPSGVDIIIRLLIFAGFVVFASIIPLTLGGKLMDKIGASKLTGDRLAKGLGSKAWQGTGVPRRTKGFLEARRNSRIERENLKDERRRAKLAEKGGLGRYAAGVNRDQADTLGAKARANYIKSQNPDQYSAKQKRMKMFEAERNGNKFESLAWEEHLWQTGEMPKGISDEEKEFSKKHFGVEADSKIQQMFDRDAEGNGAILNGAAKGDNDYFINSKNAEFTKAGIARAANANVPSKGELKALGRVASGLDLEHLGDADAQRTAMEDAQRILKNVDERKVNWMANREGGKYIDTIAGDNYKDAAGNKSNTTLAHMPDSGVEQLAKVVREREYAPDSDVYRNVKAEAEKRGISFEKPKKGAKGESSGERRGGGFKSWGYDRDAGSGSGGSSGSTSSGFGFGPTNSGGSVDGGSSGPTLSASSGPSASGPSAPTSAGPSGMGHGTGYIRGGASSTITDVEVEDYSVPTPTPPTASAAPTTTVTGVKHARPASSPEHTGSDLFSEPTRTSGGGDVDWSIPTSTVQTKSGARTYASDRGSVSVPVEMEKDSRYKEIFNKLSNKKVAGRTHVYSDYNGEVSPSGYLLDKQGKETTQKASMIIQGEDMVDVAQEAKKEFTKKYPEETKAYEGGIASAFHSGATSPAVEHKEVSPSHTATATKEIEGITAHHEDTFKQQSGPLYTPDSERKVRDINSPAEKERESLIRGLETPKSAEAEKPVEFNTDDLHIDGYNAEDGGAKKKE